MTWDTSIVRALSPSGLKPAAIHFRASEQPTVRILIDSKVRAEGSGADFFESLISARRELERAELLMVCNGARRGVHPSAMQRQLALGRNAYLLSARPKGERAPVVDIFGTAPGTTDIVTVRDQLDWWSRWIELGPGEFLEAHV